MARIRTIKPEFPQSESVGRLSRDARLLFIQIWTVVDDQGRARAAARLLAGQLYPYDDDAPKLILKWLAELEQGGFIRLYEIEGSQYLDIPAWWKHQRIDNAGKSNLPEFRREPPRTAASDGEPPLDLGPRTIGEDLGPRKESSSVAVATRRQPDDDWPSDFREAFWENYPRKVGKQAAIKELERVRKRKIPWPKLIEAVRAYAATADPQFTKHPQTWLSKGCWDDEPDTRKPHAAPGSVIAASDRLNAKLAEFERGDEPELLTEIRGGTGPPHVRLLSSK